MHKAAQAAADSKGARIKDRLRRNFYRERMETMKGEERAQKADSSQQTMHHLNTRPHFKINNSILRVAI